MNVIRNFSIRTKLSLLTAFLLTLIFANSLFNQKTLNEVFTSQGHKLWPRGIYRFKTHEEADAWKWKMIRPKKVS